MGWGGKNQRDKQRMVRGRFGWEKITVEGEGMDYSLHRNDIKPYGISRRWCEGGCFDLTGRMREIFGG
jgi:hypothetical protein